MRLFETKISPYYAKNDIAQVIESGNLGFGSNVIKFEDEFKSYSNRKYNIALNSASAAAFIIFAYLKEKFGKCDVYTPSIGFTSVAWAAKHHGHNLIFVEVDDNMLMDIEDYERERRLRCERYSDGGIKPVVMPILYGGVSSIPKLEECITEGGYNEFVIIDSAHCATPNIKSDVTFFSFHPYKPIAASDGGMISTDLDDLDSYTRSYRNFGRENTEDGYEISAEGFKFYMNNLNATIALTQLECYEENLQVRKENFEHLKDMNLKGKLIPHDNKSSYYVATLIADTEDIAKEYRDKYCKDRLYPPLHLQKYYNSICKRSLDKTLELYKLLVNLPLYNRLTTD